MKLNKKFKEMIKANRRSIIIFTIEFIAYIGLVMFSVYCVEHLHANKVGLPYLIVLNYLVSIDLMGKSGRMSKKIHGFNIFGS